MTFAIQAAALKYRAIVLLGPRQSGKTTLTRNLFPDFRYLWLEDPDLRRRGLSDPRASFRVPSVAHP